MYMLPWKCEAPEQGFEKCNFGHLSGLANCSSELRVPFLGDPLHKIYVVVVRRQVFKTATLAGGLVFLSVSGTIFRPLPYLRVTVFLRSDLFFTLSTKQISFLLVFNFRSWTGAFSLLLPVCFAFPPSIIKFFFLFFLPLCLFFLSFLPSFLFRSIEESPPISICYWIILLKYIIPKTIGNRKRDCAWGCARGIDTTRENPQIEKHQSVRWPQRTPSWFVLFDLQIFSGGVYPPSATSRTISFSGPIIFGINLIHFFDEKKDVFIVCFGPCHAIWQKQTLRRTMRRSTSQWRRVAVCRTTAWTNGEGQKETNHNLLSGCHEALTLLISNFRWASSTKLYQSHLRLFQPPEEVDLQPTLARESRCKCRHFIRPMIGLVLGNSE